MKHSMRVTVLNTIKNLIDIALWGKREGGEKEREREGGVVEREKERRGRGGGGGRRERAAITNMMESFCMWSHLDVFMWYTT
jgi:plasmid stabilization system protein ParE